MLLKKQKTFAGSFRSNRKIIINSFSFNIKMVKYNSLNVRSSNSQLKKLKSAKGNDTFLNMNFHQI